MIEFTTPGNAEVIPYEFDARKIWKTSVAEVIRLVIPPGKSQELHDNPYDVIFYVLKGPGELLLENGSLHMESESCTEVKTGSKRAWKNNGNNDLILLVIKLLN